MNFKQTSRFLGRIGVFIFLGSLLSSQVWCQSDENGGGGIEEPPSVEAQSSQTLNPNQEQAECHRSVHDYLQYVKKSSKCSLHKDKKLACMLPNGRVVVHPNIKNRFVVGKSKNLKNDIIKYYQKEYCKKWQSIDVEAMLELN